MSVPGKECRRCFEVKLFSEFHKYRRLPDGYQTWCKSCINEYKREWRENRRTPEERKQRKRVLENKELVKGGSKRCKVCWEIKSLDEYHKAEGTGDVYADCVECRYKRLAPTKNNKSPINRPEGQEKAMKAVHYAIERGKLERPDTCEVCGKAPKRRRYTRIHFHHTDGYKMENWFVGIFVCARCHVKIHQGKIEVVGRDFRTW